MDKHCEIICVLYYNKSFMFHRSLILIRKRNVLADVNLRVSLKITTHYLNSRVRKNKHHTRYLPNGIALVGRQHFGTADVKE